MIDLRIDGAGSDDRSTNKLISFGAAMAAVWIHVETELSHHAQYHVSCRLASTCLMIVGASCMLYISCIDSICIVLV